MGQGSTSGKTLGSSHLPPTRSRPEILEELGCTDRGNQTMDQEERHCFLSAELNVTGKGDQSEDVTEVAAPREDSEDTLSTSAAAAEEE
ncbi:hypothetical protein Hamer_G013162 [Homarus americanus]|uniref:Uncharacterized protein n=1 Tax=Homarus americanus TaxID=6706 RepID=A0A8J5MVT0_HOMAM|nr:hypothetical protein Hamer_G013162 [Homarus americanus]